MSQFDNILVSQGVPIMRQVFGEEALYTRKDGSEVATWVMPSTDLGFAGQRNIRAETQLSVEIPVADLVIDPQPGEHVTFKSKTYVVDQLLDNDGLFFKVAIR